jgi:hypothetical protein
VTATKRLLLAAAVTACLAAPAGAFGQDKAAEVKKADQPAKKPQKAKTAKKQKPKSKAADPAKAANGPRPKPLDAAPSPAPPARSGGASATPDPSGPGKAPLKFNPKGEQKP